NFDTVTVPALPTGWTTATTLAPAWVTSNAGTPAPASDTAPNAAFIDDPGASSDKTLTSPSIAIGPGGASVTFRHNWILESGFDGAWPATRPWPAPAGAWIQSPSLQLPARPIAPAAPAA